jgi:hypothetical protein
VRRNDGECLWSGEKTDEATKGDEDAKLRWLDYLTSEVPQSVGVALVVEMNPSLSADFLQIQKLLMGQQLRSLLFETEGECVAIVRRRGRLSSTTPVRCFFEPGTTSRVRRCHP